MPHTIESLSLEQLRALATRRAVYRPPHVAADLGVSHDCVIRALNKRPALFPSSEPGLKRRREWISFEVYLLVLGALCSISPHAARTAHQRLAAGNVVVARNRSGKRAENATNEAPST